MAPMEWRADWYWSDKAQGYVLRALTLNLAVAEQSAKQWEHELGRPCQAEIYDTFCGQQRYTIVAPRLAGEWK